MFSLLSDSSRPRDASSVLNLETCTIPKVRPITLDEGMLDKLAKFNLIQRYYHYNREEDSPEGEAHYELNRKSFCELEILVRRILKQRKMLKSYRTIEAEGSIEIYAPLSLVDSCFKILVSNPSLFKQLGYFAHSNLFPKLYRFLECNNLLTLSLLKHFTGRKVSSVTFSSVLHSFHANDLWLDEVSTFKHLISLDLGNCKQISDKGILKLASSCCAKESISRIKLKRIILNGLSDLTDESVAKLVKANQSSLEELQLNKLYRITWITLRVIKRCSKLRVLSLVKCKSLFVKLKGFESTQLKELYLRGTCLVGIESLKGIVENQELRKLDISYTSLGNAGCLEIAPLLPQLTWLNISGNSFDHTGFQYLTASGLFSLDLSNCYNLARINLDPFSSLVELSFENLDLSKLPLIQLSSSTKFTHLRKLNLNNTKVSAALMFWLVFEANEAPELLQVLLIEHCVLRENFFENLSLLKNLKELDVSHSESTFEPYYIQCFSSLKKLVKLNLSRNTFSSLVCMEEGQRAFDVVFEHCADLAELDLSYNDFLPSMSRSLRINVLRNLVACKRLRYLDLSQTDFPPKVFNELGHLTSLKRLSVSSKQFEDKMVDGLLNLENLEILDIAGNENVTNKTLESLKGSLVSKSLVSLNISRTGIDEKGLLNLVSFPNLFKLNIRSLSISSECLERLLRESTAICRFVK
eukprot:snap_masked-scaffold_5-processed-gene-17.26-mRNA-1 protein AED:1.00 eAED:1.00 QI:0/-1/0/0/-1/1/1/0/696